MLRIGIVGSDNSHALIYSTMLNVEQVGGDEVRAVAIWGQEAERTREDQLGRTCGRSARFTPARWPRRP